MAHHFHYVGLTYIIVYVGAIAVLFVFVIMIVRIDPHPSLHTLSLS